MPFYLNVGKTEKSYFGVSVKPGEVADIPGYVMDLQLVKVDNVVTIDSAADEKSKKNLHEETDKSSSRSVSGRRRGKKQFSEKREDEVKEENTEEQEKPSEEADVFKEEKSEEDQEKL